MTKLGKIFAGAAFMGGAATAAVFLAPVLSGTAGDLSARDANSSAPEIQLAQAETQAFAGGATSIREDYHAWQVNCRMGEEGRQCSMVQQFRNRESGQRILAVELRKTSEGLSGTMVLPFGLHLDDGVSLRVDEAEPRASLRFSTCLPVGCVVPLSIDTAFLEVLTRGGVLAVLATAQGGSKVELQISLQGFSAANARIVELAG